MTAYTIRSTKKLTSFFLSDISVIFPRNLTDHPYRNIVHKHKVPSKWTTFWMSSLLTDCFTVKELKVRNSGTDAENYYSNCTIKMYRAGQGPALVTDLLKCTEATGKGLQNAQGVKGITRRVMIGLMCPLRGQGKAMRAVGCTAGAKGTAKIQTLVLQNRNGQVRGDRNGTLLAV